MRFDHSPWFCVFYLVAQSLTFTSIAAAATEDDESDWNVSQPPGEWQSSLVPK